MVWLAPLWLAALSALAIPLFIHLRRRRIGRRLQVGSLRHLTGAATPRRRQLRIREPWLLLLRMGILAALALALAGPALIRREAPRRWALVMPRLAGSRAAAVVVDSLRRSGADLRLLAPGFPPMDSRSPRADATGSTPDLWSLLRAASGELPPGSSIVAVVEPSLALARGRRPRLPVRAAIRSIPRSGNDTAAVEAAWRVGDSVFRMVAQERGGGTTRSIRAETSRPADSSLIPADSLTVRIAAAADRRDDARFVRAAFGAAAAAAGVPVTITSQPPTGPDASRGATGAASASGVVSRAWSVWLGISKPDSARGFLLVDSPAAIHRADDVSLTEPRTDAYGRRLLQSRQGGRIHTFAGRFNPAQGDLVLGTAFPEMIAQLWAASALGVPASLTRDHRAVAPAQLEPSLAASGPVAGRPYPLRHLLLGLCALLLAWERWLAWRRP